MSETQQEILDKLWKYEWEGEREFIPREIARLKENIKWYETRLKELKEQEP